VVSPLICFFVNLYSTQWFNGYQIGFEVLVLNGLLTFIGLFAIAKNQNDIPVEIAK